MPPAAAGAALLALLERDLLPDFAVGEWCDTLQRSGQGQPVPERLCWAGEDVIVLAPWRADGGHIAGFVIAERGAIGQRRVCWSEQGESVELEIPQAITSGKGGFVFAVADARLPIVHRHGLDA